MVEQLTPDQPVSGSIPLVLTFLAFCIVLYLYSLISQLEDLIILLSSFLLRALIAQSVEHGANNARVVGSSPTGSIFYLIQTIHFMLVNSLIQEDFLDILEEMLDI